MCLFYASRKFMKLIAQPFNYVLSLSLGNEAKLMKLKGYVDKMQSSAAKIITKNNIKIEKM